MIIYKQNRKILANQIKDMKRENELLEKRLEEFRKTPEKAYYRIAREELGMIKKGEYKYRFIEKAENEIGK